MRKKTLVFMYIADSYGFYGQKFNFSTQEKFNVKMGDDGDLILTTEEYTNKLPPGFWGKNISEISLFVGENGAGKTTVMRLICQWICHLSQKKFPWEKGILVFREENDFKYVAFAEGKEISVSAEIPKIEKHELKDFFMDIQMVYYSNTMTELKVDGYDILRDYSIPSKMKKANANGHAMGEDVIANYKCYEFQQQIKVALEDEEFPIKYILLEIKKCTLDEIGSLLINHKNDILKELEEIAESGWKNYERNLKIEVEYLKVSFLHALFIGLIVKLLKWGMRYEQNGRNGVEDVLFKMFDSKMIESDVFVGNKEGIANIKEFLEELFYNCDEVYMASVHKSKYKNYWWDVKNIIGVIDFIADKNNIPYFESWTIQPVIENVNEEKCIWKMNLKEKRKISNKFWKVYSKMNFFIENIRFSWDASSGEQSWAELFSDLKNIELHKCDQNIWYLLDEPDNTFHPEWKRRFTDRTIKALNRNDNKKQIWISTHSPIMLSDMPGQAAIYLKKDILGQKTTEEKKMDTFGQNIYVLFDDAFFLKNGVIGEFASDKILETVLDLENIEKTLLDYKVKKQLPTGEMEGIFTRLTKNEEIVHLVAEPIFGRQIQHYVNNCKKLLEKVKYDSN